MSDVTYEVWADYADATHNGRTASKPSRRIVAVDNRAEADHCIEGARFAETGSRAQAKALGQAHYDASFRLVAMREVRTVIDPANYTYQQDL